MTDTADERGRSGLSSALVSAPNTASPDPATALRWWADGELVVAGSIDRLTDDDLASDSNLPGWSRAHVVAPDVDRTWGSGGSRVEGPVAAVAAWLTRGDADGLSGDVPPPPRWL